MTRRCREQPPDADPDRILFETGLVQVGEFRCGVSHPRFSDSGPIKTYCFVFPRRPVWIQHDGCAPFVADPTVVPLYNAGQQYRRRRISLDGDLTDWFGVSADLLRAAVAAYDPRTADAPHQLFRSSFARSKAATFLSQRLIFDHVRSSSEPDVFFIEESVVATLDDVLSEAYEAGGHTRLAAARHVGLAEDTRAYLAETFTRREGLAEVARAVGASVFHLCRVFRRHTGSTIHAYRGGLRVRRSLELLGDFDGDILRVAVELGYSGHSHFTRAFHRAFGMTPSDFRRGPRVPQVPQEPSVRFS